MEEICAARDYLTDRFIDRYESVMASMTRLVNYELPKCVRVASNSNGACKNEVQQLNGRYWKCPGTPDLYSCAVHPVRCNPMPTGKCSCGLPRCCERAPYYQTHIYAEIGRLERKLQTFENPNCI